MRDAYTIYILAVVRSTFYDIYMVFTTFTKPVINCSLKQLVHDLLVILIISSFQEEFKIVFFIEKQENKKLHYHNNLRSI